MLSESPEKVTNDYKEALQGKTDNELFLTAIDIYLNPRLRAAAEVLLNEREEARKKYDDYMC